MLDRLNQAMDRLERQLTGEGGAAEEIDIAELARIAATSTYHFRRMFSALAGVPLSEYIRRRRLTLAGAEVLDGRRTLLDIAVRHGYTSAEAFARAFRAVHGVAPGEARRTQATLSSQPRMSFHLTIEGSRTMRYRIVTKPAFQIAGYRARVPLVHEGVNPAIADFIRGIPEADQDRLEELAEESGQEPGGVLGVVDNFAGDREEGTELDYYHGVLIDPATRQAPAGLATLPVPAGTWAVFASSGDFPLTLQYLWRDIYTQWFPSNPYRSRPGPEMVRVDLSDDGTTADAEIWIPAEPA
jgi:AraC family transcriptional regulator